MNNLTTFSGFCFPLSTVLWRNEYKTSTLGARVGSWMGKWVRWMLGKLFSPNFHLPCRCWLRSLHSADPIDSLAGGKSKKAFRDDLSLTNYHTPRRKREKHAAAVLTMPFVNSDCACRPFTYIFYVSAKAFFCWTFVLRRVVTNPGQQRVTVRNSKWNRRATRESNKFRSINFVWRHSSE